MSWEPGGLIVALHDVAPPFESQVRCQLDTLARCGIHRVVLHVVPNWHGRHPIGGCQSLLDLLHDQVASGSEIALHGLEHRPHGRLRGSSWNQLRGTIFAPNAAEFLSLVELDVADAVRAGLDSLAAAELPRPSTFCAPGWLMTTEARRAVARAGLRRIADMFSVDNFDRRRRDVMPSLGFMGASAIQESGIGLLNKIMGVVAVPRSRAVQLYLHPSQGSGDAAETRVLERAASMVRSEGWRPTTFAEWYGD